MQPELTSQQTACEWTLDKFVLGRLAMAYRKFCDAPTASRFVELNEAMVVRQAWWQRKRPSTWEAYPSWLDAMALKSVSDELNDDICLFVHGKTLPDLMKDFKLG